MILNVASSKPYDVVIQNSYSALSAYLKTLLKGDKVLIVFDENVATTPFYNEVCSIVENSTKQMYRHILPSGEHTKSEKYYFALLKILLNNGFSRKDTIIAFGGGVVGDLVGFTASTYMRGIQLIQIPTTLLSMVDSSVGGKTAIDLDNTKNVVGTFYSASLVYINVKTLQTLPQREINSGMGEVIKYTFLSKTVDQSYLNYSDIKNDDEKVINLVAECLKIKKNIVEVDEFESGKRALLNLGHTVGHAIEALSDYSISHGECVLKGLNKAIDISKKYYSLSDSVYNAMKKIIKNSGIPTDYPYSKNDIIQKIMHDKKTERDGTNFVLLKDIGDANIVKLTKEELHTLL